MPRPSDCIFCGADTGSREHSFPAALGGRRKNKGILCGPCNLGFSCLDEEIRKQLAFFNGLLGVRGDHNDEPHPAEIVGPTGTILLDSMGTPSLAEAYVSRDEVEADGTRTLVVAGTDESQVQEWIANQRAQGHKVKRLSRRQVHQFLPDGHRASWSMGGAKALRGIARVALNFLAHQFPELARAQELRPFKDFVQGKLPTDDELAYVWHARAEDPQLPEPFAPFAHQVLVTVAPSGSHARVRFFSTLDVCVFFGDLPATTAQTILFEIDPLAERPPDDRTETDLAHHPEMPARPVARTGAPADAEVIKARTALLLARIDERQWTLRTAGLLQEINGLHACPASERRDAVMRVVWPHRGQVLSLARRVVKQAAEQSSGPAPSAADLLALLVESDEDGADGLTEGANAALRYCVLKLADHIAVTLGAGPLTQHDLRLLLSGARGLSLVGQAMTELAVASLAGAPRG